ncbi:Fis family transcriptional regulator [Psychromonas sp. SR45-3]|uniref:Fis family transcriptional regulator n=1 Tax=Psychromonas sp. SR45-3 TaxID=2760930 RepID=UPI0015FB5B6A|nr:Fis family transcriptional regulator [Psychromonas sp. SR45-3]MBB1274154.1 Fis family transcriptional regulator [Psychromonas sp. SR45-3]
MRKTDKKIDKNLRAALTEVCEIALDTVQGYQWITHSVKYDAFPASLQISCGFVSVQAIEQLQLAQQDILLKKLIVKHLMVVGINLKDVNKQVKFVVA